MGKFRLAHLDCSWPIHQYKIANKDTNGDTRSKPQPRYTWKKHAQGPSTQHNPLQAERSQEQDFIVTCSRCYHQQPGWCIEDSRYTRVNRGIRPGDPVTSPDYPHWRRKVQPLITLSREIDFTATSHFTTHKYRDIFKSFWSIYVLYLKRGFKITTVHADGDFSPVQ